MRYSLYSFDIFDTCLCRTCGDPVNVFDILARRVLGDDATLSNLADFRYIRIKGEINARKESKEEDITLSEIYRKCDFSGLTMFSNDEIANLELMTERDVLSPIFSTLKKIEHIHEQGNNVAYISDMYLSTDFIKEILKTHGFYEEGDKIYISGELGETKRTGSLFKYVAVQEKTPYKKWHHEGDNLFSDYLTPRKLGIKARRVEHSYSYYQKRMIWKEYNPYFNLLGINAGISRSISIGFKDSIRMTFAADLIAPIYVPFVYYVMNDAQLRGIKRLYFLARDGYIFYKIAQTLQSSFPNIEPHYIYVSRKSLYLPSLTKIDEEAIKSLLNGLSRSNVYELLDNLQINFGESFYERAKNENNLVAFLANDKDIVTALDKRRQEQRLNCIDYLVQEGLADNIKKTAIVDLRGTRRCQTSINTLLMSEGYSKVFAYYLEANHNRIVPNTLSEYDALFFGDRFDNKKFKGLDLSSIIFEHYSSLTIDSRTAGYRRENGKIVPEFDKHQMLKSDLIDIVNVNLNACQAYAESFMKIRIGMFSKEIAYAGLANLSEFMLLPNRRYLKALLGVYSSETQYESRALVKRISFHDITHKTIAWYDGSIMLSYGRVAYKLFIYIIRRCQRIIRNLH